MTINIMTDADTYTIDQVIKTRIEGLTAGTDVTFIASMVDDEDVQWRSEVVFTAPAAGVVDVNHTAPESGSWSGADIDAFLWSMAPCAAEDFDDFRLNGKHEIAPNLPSPHRFGLPSMLDNNPITLTLSALISGEEVASKTVIRHRFHPDVEETEVRDGRLVGNFFVRKDAMAGPAVLVLGGSGGGIPRAFAALLAAQGFAALALGYFNVPGSSLPPTHGRIPLEYFAEGIDWLRARVGHDRVGIIGASRGGEGVLAIASAFPDKVKAVIAEVPGDIYMLGGIFPEHYAPAWTLNGKDLPAAWRDDVPSLPELAEKNSKLYPRRDMYSFFEDPKVYEECAIPVENMRCPVMFVSAEDDQTWPSYLASCRAIERLKAAAYAWPIEHVWEPDAGHLVSYPGYPTVMSDGGYFPLTELFISFGGTASGAARIQRRAWERTISFLNQHLAEAVAA